MPFGQHFRGALVALIVVSGCSLTTSLDGLSSGGAPSPSDGGSDARPLVDGGADVTTADTGTDSGPADPCDGSIFCDTFERNGEVKGSWLFQQLQGGGTLAFDSTTAARGTTSLKMLLPLGTTPRAYLSWDSTTTTSNRARVAWSTRSDVAPDRETQLMRLELQSTTRNTFVFVAFVPGNNIVLAEQREEDGVSPSATYSNVDLNSGFVPGKWQRWSLELDARTSPARAEVLLDGVRIGQKTLNNPVDTGKIGVILGGTFLRDGPVRTIWFDDVAVFDVR